MSLGQKPQGPLNTFLPKGQGGAFGVHSFNVVGSGIFGNRNVPPTGMPTGVGSGGVPDVSATYLATGIYDIRFPPTFDGNISASVSSSSGYNFSAYVNNQSFPSGSAQLEIVRDAGAGGGSSGAHLVQASGFRGFLPTGTKVSLSFFAAPSANGITSY
jgi:hypothetical protein